MRRLGTGVFAVLLAFPHAGSAACTLFDPVGQGWTPSFVEDFADFTPQEGGRWATSFVWGGRTIPTNNELQVYVDPAYAGDGDRPLGLNPFVRERDGLAITAMPVEGDGRGAITGFAYTSGLLTTATSFRQTYGYFEIRAKLPAGKGLWPAFWLLQPDGKWPPEIDVFEVLGQDPGRRQMTVHSADRGRHWSKSTTIRVDDTSAAFHDYGVLWSADRLVWYHDRCPVAETTTPADLHEPMYMLINLAVGGLAGKPDHATRFPAKLLIQRVIVYALPGDSPSGRLSRKTRNFTSAWR